MNKGLSILLALALVLSMGLVMAGPMATPAAAAPPVTSGLVLHLDATTLGLADGAGVVTWPDQSGNNNDATQATGANQPTYKAGILHGKPVVRFDGSNDYMSVADSAELNPANMTIIAVVTRASTGAWHHILDKSVDGSQTNGYRFTVTDANKFRFRYRDTANILRAAFSTANLAASTHLLTARFDGTNVGLFIGGVLDSTTSLPGTIQHSSSALTIGYSFGAGTLDGDIAEILIYDRALNDVERQGVEQYLAMKWLGAVSNEVWVCATNGNDSYPGSADYPFATIQKGVAEVAPGGTVNVKAGEYEEEGQITVTKDVTVIGAGKTETTIKPGAGFSGSYFFRVDDGTFTLTGFTLDGTSALYGGVRFGNPGTGTVHDNNIKNVRSGTYMGFGVVVYGDNVTVSHNTFTNIGRVGIWVGAQDALVEGNTYTGKGAGDVLDYGIEVGAGGSATITGNTITDCGPSTTSWASAAIIVTDLYGKPVRATIEENTLTGNQYGIGVGYGDDDESDVTANWNSIVGNTLGLRNWSLVTVDATLNWWGHASGPYHETDNPGGKGDDARGDVDFMPWLMEEDGAKTTETDTDLGVDASAATDSVSATADGGGTDTTVTVGEYLSEPTGFDSGLVAGSFYFDVHVGGTLPDELVITAQCPGGDCTETVLRWFNGLIWQDVSPVSYTNGEVIATLSATSSPTISQLTGTPFGLGNPTDYGIMATAGPGGTIDPDGLVVVDIGEDQTFTITPATGHWIVRVLVDGKSVGAVDSYTFTNVTASHTIHAVFWSPASGTAAKLYGLRTSSTEGGRVTAPREGLTPYYGGTRDRIVATPAEGYRFVEWTGDVDTIADVNSASTTIVVMGWYRITAVFEADVEEVVEYDLTIESSEGGSVTAPGEGTFTYEEGTVVELVAEAAEGYSFVAWSGNVTAIADIYAAATNITMSEDFFITANFESEDL